MIENSERLGAAGAELFRQVGFTDTELEEIQGETGIAVFGLAALEIVSEIDLNGLEMFGGTNGYEVVSEEFIRDGIRCLIEALDLDGVKVFFAGLETSILTKQAFKEAVEEIIKQVVKRSTALAVSGAAGAAIILLEWVWCMRDHWT